jgi:hypothetical protein
MVVQFLIACVHVDGGAGDGLQFCRAADVVDVGVRDHNRLHLQGMAGEDRQDLVDVIARVDNDGFVRLLVAENRAVALQHAHGNDFVNHSSNILGVWTLFSV